MAAVKGGDEVKDLLKSGASYEKMQMTSSPIFGPAIGGLSSKEHRQSSDCAKTFEDGLKASSKPEELVLAFFVLKQIKKGSSSEETVYVSSLCFVIAGEEVSHLTGVKDKSKSEPYTLLRYAVGGASASVCLVAVTAEESRKDSVNAALDAVKSMRQVKNSAPRSGNVKHFVDFTKNELPKQKAAAEKLNDNPEKQKSAQKIVTRMEVMLKDAQELLSKPKETKPKAY
ncbi:hypothetical protein DQ04_02431000 [Trypanosoma grayi]|uniref:hypothetical protein n=1 Tax=Trypanosoma grayi TaxID=71804 RepID=UPI0004F3F41B|nr:hypothetical protein DQ04_02431000 [Trypanosoma grayi]KEG11620.1 hypothetical protein DQ04_02431000 [Trypanosoma grayi]